MFFKRIILTAIILLMAVIGQLTFADTIDDKFELINPVIGVEGDVLVNEDMLISIRVDEDIDANVSLFKIEQRIIDLSILSKEEIDLEDTNIAKKYNEALIYSRYMTLVKKIKDTEAYLSSTGLLSSQTSISQARENLKTYYSLLSKIRPQYESLFEVSIFKNDSLIQEGKVLPFYEKLVNDIQNGEYKLVITDSEGYTLKKYSFKVKSKEIIQMEIINDLPSVINRILSTN
jgi:hypothetical protein